MVVLGVAFMVIGLIQALRLADNEAIEKAWSQLRTSPVAPIERFDPAMLEGLPDAARRYFLFTIAPGALLTRIAEIRMRGEIGLGNLKDPRYQPIRARQILAPPHGFVWHLERGGSDALQISGSDAMVGNSSWTRFWVCGALPLVRAGKEENHLRSSFGRLVAEAVFWAPAALLPQSGVQWEAGDLPCRARAVVSNGMHKQALEIEVAPDGRPSWVKISRWSNANRDREWRVQPFGGTVDDFRTFDGFTLPTRVVGGNHFGTQDYFPFFRAQVEQIHFPLP